MVSGITQRNSHETGIAFFLCQTYLFFRRKLGIIYESGHFMSFKLFLCISSDLSVDIGSIEHGKQTNVLTEKLFLGVSSCSQKEERRIQVIHSYEETYAAYPEFNRMIAGQFEKEKIDADIRTVYLDCESYW